MNFLIGAHLSWEDVLCVFQEGDPEENLEIVPLRKPLQFLHNTKGNELLPNPTLL